MIPVEHYIKFLIKHKLTQSQFLLLYLSYKKRQDLVDLYAEHFPSDDGTMIGNYLIKDLIKKQFVIEEGGKYEIGKKFLEIFVNEEIATEEIFNIYPSYYHKNGIDYPLSIMDRRTFSKLYFEAIQGSYEEHTEVLNDIRFGIDKNFLIIPIDKFVKSHYWKVLRQMRKQNTEIKNIVPDTEQEF